METGNHLKLRIYFQATANAASTAPRSRFVPKPRDDLIACSNCGRNFAEDRIEKHQDICFKTAKKKRKAFDMTKKRLQGTDAESFNTRQTKGRRVSKFTGRVGDGRETYYFAASVGNQQDANGCLFVCLFKLESSSGSYLFCKKNRWSILTYFLKSTSELN